MLVEIQNFFFANFQLVMCLCAALISLILPKPFAHNFFSWLLLLGVGFGGVWSFVEHAILSVLPFEINSAILNSYEFEFALATLAIGMGGIVAFFANWHFRCAVVVTASVLMFGQAINQIYLYWQTNAFSNHHHVLSVWINILIPLIFIILLPINYQKPKQEYYF